MKMKLIKADRIRLICILFVVIFMTDSRLFAQLEDPFSFEYDYLPFQGLVHPQSSGPYDGNLEISYERLSTRINLPIHMSKGIVIANGFEYERLKLSYEGWNYAIFTKPPINNFYSINYIFLLRKSINKRWSWMTIIKPGLASDFEGDINAEDFAFSAIVAFTRKYSKHLSIGFGGAYSRDFGKPYPLPAFTLFWNDGNRTSAKLIVPVVLELWYKLNPYMDIAVASRIIGNQYAGEPERYGIEKPRIDFMDAVAGPAIKIKLARSTVLNMFAGYTYARKLEIQNGNDNLADYNLKRTSFMRIGVSFSPMIGGKGKPAGGSGIGGRH